MTGTGLARAAAVLVTAFAAVLCAPVAAAADDALAAGDRVLEVHSTLGALPGQAVQTIDVAIPEGFEPVALTAVLTPEMPGAGEAVVFANQVARFAAPVEGAANVNFDLSGLDVVDGLLEIGLRYNAPVSESTICPNPELQLVTLSSIEVTISGKVQPIATVGEFFSSTVEAVSVVIPDQPTLEEREAGFVAMSALAVRYPRPVVLTLATASSAANAPALDPLFGREIRIQERDEYVSTSIDSNGGSAPVLSIAGRAGELSPAAAGMASPFLELANSNDVEGPFVTLDPTASLSYTLADLGRPDIELTGYGRAETTVALRQSQFGGPVDSVTLDLSGVHSAIDGTISASIQVFWNNQLVASTMLGVDTAFSVDLTLPAAFIRPWNQLMIQLNSVPQNGCGTGVSPIIPLQLSINGTASTVTATRGQGIAPGFHRFPQVLGDRLEVAFGSQGDPESLVSAAGDLVVALQRNNVRQLVVTAPTLGQFESSGSPGLVVGATPDDARRFGAPLRYSEFRSIDGSGVEFAVGVSTPFAALQAFDAAGRDILMLGGYAPTASDAVTTSLEVQIADEVANGEFGWDALSTDIAVAMTLGAPFSELQSQALIPSKTEVAEHDDVLWWVLAALGLISVLCALAVSWLRGRVVPIIAFVIALGLIVGQYAWFAQDLSRSAVIAEADTNIAGDAHYRAATDYLAEHYDGGGILLDENASGGGVLQLLGLPVIEVTARSAGVDVFQAALDDPAAHARWILMTLKLPEDPATPPHGYDAVAVAAAIDPSILLPYSLEFRSGDIAVLRRFADPILQ